MAWSLNEGCPNWGLRNQTNTRSKAFLARQRKPEQICLLRQNLFIPELVYPEAYNKTATLRQVRRADINEEWCKAEDKHGWFKIHVKNVTLRVLPHDSRLLASPVSNNATGLLETLHMPMTSKSSWNICEIGYRPKWWWMLIYLLSEWNPTYCMNCKEMASEDQRHAILEHRNQAT